MCFDGILQVQALSLCPRLELRSIAGSKTVLLTACYCYSALTEANHDNKIATIPLCHNEHVTIPDLLLLLARRGSVHDDLRRGPAMTVDEQHLHGKQYVSSVFYSEIQSLVDLFLRLLVRTVGRAGESMIAR